MGQWSSQPINSKPFLSEPLLPGKDHRWVSSSNACALKLYRAWWGQPIIEHQSVDSKRSPPIINLEHSVDNLPLGKILLRQEYIHLRDLLVEAVLSFPEKGLLIGGQPGIGKPLFVRGTVFLCY